MLSLLFLIGAVYVQAISTGFGTGCNVWNNYGSADQTNNGAIMWWATPPVRNTDYTLRTGDGDDILDDPIHYQPDTVLTLHLDVRKLGGQYRGLLLYAVNRSEYKVGSWSFPETSPPTFHIPQESGCDGKAVVHAQAALKGYRETFYFHTPPKGTGVIKFRLLLKLGGPNVGAFALPMREDLTLFEADADMEEIQATFTGAPGQSCSDVCKQKKTTCNAEALLSTYSVDSEQQAEMAGSKFFTCHPPLLQDCSQKLPVVDDPLVDTSTTSEFQSCVLPMACENTDLNTENVCDQVSKDHSPICPCVMKYKTVGEQQLAEEQREQEQIESLDKVEKRNTVLKVFMWMFFIVSIVLGLYILKNRRKMRHVSQITLRDAGNAKPAPLDTMKEVSFGGATMKETSLDASVSAVSSEWEERVDEDSGATYYYNSKSGESTWEKPAGFA